jgi:hypothetical protein
MAAVADTKLDDSPGARAADSAEGVRADEPRGDERRCRWCGRRFVPTPGRGRPRLYCRQGCRQQAHMARKLAAAHGLDAGELVVSRADLEELQSRLYSLQAAIEDVDGDLAASSDPSSVADALGWLLENARPLAQLWIEPRVGQA